VELEVKGRGAIKSVTLALIKQLDHGLFFRNITFIVPYKNNKNF